MSAPRFSIVIPTRNRARTLAYALQTCLFQEFEDFEVVVSDNFSSPETRQVAEECADRRVKYVRTPADLAMTDSLEFAVSHATGEYVTIIGDDDGYLLHGLAEMDRILRLTDIAALRWDSALYNWPWIAPQSYALPNALLLPLHMNGAYHSISRYDSAPRIQAAVDGEISYADLPMIFCSVIRRDIFARLKRETSRYFKSRTPDVYAAFAVAHAAGNYYSISAPLAIAGTSGYSTGIARHFSRGSNAIDRDFRKLNDEAGHSLHSEVPDLPPILCATADAFLYVREALFPNDASLALDRRRLVTLCLREVVTETEEEWDIVLAECRRALADDPELLAWFNQEYAGTTSKSRSFMPPQQARRRFGGNYLCLDASEFGVADVAGAALLCEKILGYQRDRLNPRIVDQSSDTFTSLSELQEKEAVIHRLDQAVKDRDQVIHHLDQQIKKHEEFQARVRQPFRRALPHLIRKVVGRLTAAKQ